MSTRCQIGFYADINQPIPEPDALIYRHADGYPGTPDGEEYGVMSEIAPFLVWFNKRRGCGDTAYVAARLLQFMCNKYDGEMAEIDSRLSDDSGFKHPTANDNNPYTGILGHGICKKFYSDIEYYYAIFPDRIEVTEPDINWETGNMSSVKILSTWTWAELETEINKGLESQKKAIEAIKLGPGKLKEGATP